VRIGGEGHGIVATETFSALVSPPVSLLSPPRRPSPLPHASPCLTFRPLQHATAASSPSSARIVCAPNQSSQPGRPATATTQGREVQVLLGVRGGVVVMDDALPKNETGCTRRTARGYGRDDDNACDGHLSDDELQGPRLQRRATATATTCARARPCHCPRCSGCCGLFVVSLGHGGGGHPRELVALRTLREASHRSGRGYAG